MTLTNLLRRISLKHITHQKARTFIVMFGISLGVATMVAIDIVNVSVIRSFEESINNVTGKAVLQVTGAESGFPDTMLERVQKVPGVEYALPVIQTNAIFSDGSKQSFMILGVDALQDQTVPSSRNAIEKKSPSAMSVKRPLIATWVGTPGTLSF